MENTFINLIFQKRIEKAEEEYHKTKKMAEKSMNPVLKKKYFQAQKKLEKVWHSTNAKG